MANAWDGSAYHLNPSSAPITSFFTANARTCRDWLSRLRVTMVQLSFNLGEHAFCVRQGQHALTQMVAAGRSSSHTSEFNSVAALLAVSLLKLGSAQALSGLYTWCKDKAGKVRFESSFLLQYYNLPPGVYHRTHVRVFFWGYSYGIQRKVIPT